MNERVQLDPTTLVVINPTWDGGRFEHSDAQAIWVALPASLQRHTEAEVARGNRVRQLLRNEKRGIVLLEFERGPLVEEPPPNVVVHTHHAFGNYCYHGTKCTYEDTISGSFLAFADPEYRDPDAPD